MPALRSAIKRHRWLGIALVALLALATVAICDWSKPPGAQASVRLYDRGVWTIYHGWIRPVTSHFVQCRYQPTCSIYSLIAVQTYGFPKGLWLTMKRLCRCVPWVPMGTYDPVPMPPPKPPRQTIRAPR